MNSEKLSLRLEIVAKYIPSGARLADIGSDHAYLPCHVVQKGVVPFAIAGEVAEGPFQSATGQVEAKALAEKISVRKGDGLEVIEPGEVDCITIAGMGGALIASILEAGKGKLESVKRLILQPNISAFSIRTWLLENKWGLTGEEIVEEDGKIYEILVAEQTDTHAAYGDELEKGLLFGPFLLKEKNPVFQKKWHGEKENWLKIVRNLEHASATDENNRKKQELLRKVQLAEEVLGQ
ncbi:tRNA (adenine(22)-N(1))-methyltransferase [Bacillus benzoevorans]|uniref:tRNA (Adenine22-N1)-methyltransferase n=1 Tax=Bacillus benzoevorans TaxID=1456 RepID=A0A7X0HUN7_9BACI|nr:tRNA (adenine(22)-N(1))-methyltransferase TrmK [Bacillus benzoevorans]MBB6446000.1 tRNA (adenine22-N1)-methyltransferase [Bacillus benzoevorans]